MAPIRKEPAPRLRVQPMSRFLAFVAFLFLAACQSSSSASDPSFAYPAPSGETSNGGAPKPYPLATCIVSGKRLESTAVTFVVGNRTFRTCCASCQRTIESDAELWSRQVDAASILGQLRDYPTTTCIVSGRTIGEHATTTMHEGTLVKLCCGGCKETFTKNPAPYLRRLATAKCASFGNIALGSDTWNAEQIATFVEQQAKTYPLTTCPISGKPLTDDKATDLVLEDTLVRVCCEDCVEKAKDHATEIVTKIQSAAFAAQKMDYPLDTCVLSKQPLGERAASTMVGTLLVRTCTTNCASRIAEDLVAVTAKIHAARKAQADATKNACCGDGADCCCASKR